MTAQRKPARPQYDALVELGAMPEIGSCALTFVKFTLTFAEGRTQITAPEPLFHDVRNPDLKPRFKEGTDFWALKTETDFVVQGSACAPLGEPVRQMQVSVRVGNSSKRIAVFGKRLVAWGSGGSPRIPEPEPFGQMPLTYQNAYGGIDWRVRVPNPDSPRSQMLKDVDHPGLYPRNPFGKGYVVLPGAVPGTEMPNLEDPDNLLTVDRLVVGDPREWFRQPLPWCFDWMHAMMFPRFVFFGPAVDAWFPGPEDQTLSEVSRGFIPKGYRRMMASWSMAQGAHPRFYQEASLGLVLSGLQGGEPVVLEGMHPAHRAIRFPLPMPLTSLEIEIEGNRQAVPARLHSVVCRPGDGKLCLLFAGHRVLPRPFLPGIHKHIPVSVRVNGDAPVPYQTPPTIRERLAAAQAKPAQLTKP